MTKYDARHMWRQQGIFMEDGERTRGKISIIGAGGIGSTAALVLMRMGAGTVFAPEGPKSSEVRIWDGDTVEIHNLPTQMFGVSDIGKKKVDALKELISTQTGHEIIGIPEFWDGQPLEGVVVSGLDSMKMRKLLWDKGLKYKMNPLYIDGRMGGETALIYAVRPQDPDDVKFYESELNTDEEAPELPCTARAIIYNTFIIGSLIAYIYKLFAQGKPFPRETIFDFPTMSFLTRKVQE